MAGIETKTATQSVSYLAIGWLSGLLIEVVPWLKDNLTADQKQNLPIILAWLFGSVAAYYAPHTHRPDLQIPGQLTEIVSPAVTDVPLPPIAEDDPSQHVSGRAGAAPDV
jgi:hypothetical protein